MDHHDPHKRFVCNGDLLSDFFVLIINYQSVMKKLALLFFLHLCISAAIHGAIVDTVEVYSNAMNKKIQIVVISPAEKNMPAPVIYLLHGYGGDAKNWLRIKPELPQIADRHNLVFVCPDGENSWYWDSPKDPAYRYETFVSKELTAYIDANYPVIKDRKGRAITGLSMGGHGALWVAFRHTETFGVAGSTSGGVDIRPFPENWEMSKQLGSLKDNSRLWETHTVINQIDKIGNGDLALIIDCGTGDFFFEVNNNFHRKLLDKGIDHDYLVRPGVHNNEYWNNSIDYQILFFLKYFKK
jgi:S-formylglutathione hydrolase FrmB